MNEHIGLYAYLRAFRNYLVAWTHRARGTNGTSHPVPSDRSTHAGKPALRRVRDALVWNKSLRRWIYLIDLCLFLCYRAIVEKALGRVLIMDRYFYDTLVDVSDGRRWFWVRFLERLTPTPTMPVFLDIGPEESFTRKGEYTVQYLQRRYLAYKKVFEWVPTAAQVANQDLETTKSALLRTLRERAGVG